MTEGQMILEILKKMQTDLASVKRDVASHAVRMSAIEDHMRGVMTSQFGMQADLTGVNERLDRIERRLELSEEKK
jgi:hypothetical protein